MCFSATASFVSATIVGAAGIASIRSAVKPEQKYFASVPLIFAIQQLIEGVVWLSFNSVSPPAWQSFSIKVFLFFATVVWPFLVPFSVWKMEESRLRKRIIFVFLTAGVVFSIVSAWYLFTYPSSASIKEHHVYYSLDYPMRNAPIINIFYLGATIVSLLVSSRKWVPILGLLILGSYLVTRFYYQDHVISVWCFFAALVSVIIYLMVSDRLKGLESKEL
jgi:hypothetical protein